MRETAPEMCSYCTEGRAGCYCGTLADTREARDQLRRIKEALQEYPLLPQETFIGREDLAAKVTWLARRAAMLDRSDVVKWKALTKIVEIDLKKAQASLAGLEALLIERHADGGR